MYYLFYYYFIPTSLRCHFKDQKAESSSYSWYNIYLGDIDLAKINKHDFSCVDVLYTNQFHTAAINSVSSKSSDSHLQQCLK